VRGLQLISMKRFFIFVFSFVIFIVFCNKQVIAVQKIYVQYHLWYTKEDLIPGPGIPGAHDWFGWNQLSFEVTNGVNPTHFLSPWRRVTTSRLGFPLVGVYSSTLTTDAINYHFQIAKAAGIDGMFASVYNGEWKPIFTSHLTIAANSNMKLGAELYHGAGSDRPALGAPYDSFPTLTNGCTISYNYQINALAGFINQYKNNPNYIEIDGKPAVWIGNGKNVFGDFNTIFPNSDCYKNPGDVPPPVYSWGNVLQMQSVMSQVEALVGEPIYIIVTSPAKDDQNRSFGTVSQIQKMLISEADNITVFWNTFGFDIQITPQLNTTTNKALFEQNYQTQIQNAINNAGSKYAVHVYTAFDERGLYPTTQNRGSGLTVPRTVITRSGNGMYEVNDGFLKRTLDYATQYNRDVFLESWNDWNEQHQIEPGFAFNGFSEHGDFFSALRRVAEFKGISDPNFAFPSSSAVDPPILRFCRNKQWTGGKVRLKGKFGFQNNSCGTSGCTNGVSFNVSYLDDETSFRDPSYLPSQTWKNANTIVKTYTGSLSNFDIDITPYLDKPDMTFSIWSNGEATSDNIFFPEFKLDWYGQEINLLNTDLLKNLNWHSGAGIFAFPKWGNLGQVAIMNNYALEDGQTYPVSLFMAPNFNVSGDTFVAAGLNSFKPFSSYINSCDPLNPTYTLFDLSNLILKFNQNVAVGSREDVDNSLKINSLDLSILIGGFGM